MDGVFQNSYSLRPMSTFARNEPQFFSRPFLPEEKILSWKVLRKKNGWRFNFFQPLRQNGIASFFQSTNDVTITLKGFARKRTPVFISVTANGFMNWQTYWWWVCRFKEHHPSIHCLKSFPQTINDIRLQHTNT